MPRACARSFASSSSPPRLTRSMIRNARHALAWLIGACSVGLASVTLHLARPRPGDPPVAKALMGVEVSSFAPPVSAPGYSLAYTSEAPIRANLIRRLSSLEVHPAVVDKPIAPRTTPPLGSSGTATQQRLFANSSKSVAYPRARV